MSCPVLGVEGYITALHSRVCREEFCCAGQALPAHSTGAADTGEHRVAICNESFGRCLSREPSVRLLPAQHQRYGRLQALPLLPLQEERVDSISELLQIDSEIVEKTCPEAEVKTTTASLEHVHHVCSRPFRIDLKCRTLSSILYSLERQLLRYTQSYACP